MAIFKIERKYLGTYSMSGSNYHQLDAFEVEETEELEDSSYKGDEYERVFDDEAGERVFSHEFICKVLDFADGPSKQLITGGPV